MKTKECKECLGIMERTFENNIPVWICRCCGKIATRKIYNTKSKASKAQRNEYFNKLIDDLMND